MCRIVSCARFWGYFSPKCRSPFCMNYISKMYCPRVPTNTVENYKKFAAGVFIRPPISQGSYSIRYSSTVGLGGDGSSWFWLNSFLPASSEPFFLIDVLRPRYSSQARSTRKQGLDFCMINPLQLSERSNKIDPPCFRVLLAWDEYRIRRAQVLNISLNWSQLHLEKRLPFLEPIASVLVQGYHRGLGG